MSEMTVKDVGDLNFTFSNKKALTMIKKNLEDTDFLGSSVN